MREIGVSDFDEYTDLLQLNPDEFTALFNTILINVTGFFRDADAWDQLADDLLPRLIASDGDRPIRVWSAGSASPARRPTRLAMLLGRPDGRRFRERVKIYATDVDEEALTFARQASYTERRSGACRTDREPYFDPAGRATPSAGPAAQRHLRPQRPDAGCSDLADRPAWRAATR